jgi:teichoic acid transport system permease protein
MAVSRFTRTGSFAAARQYLRDLWERREFIAYLAWANLKSRNASTALGLFWWILNPLLLGGVYLLVFGVVFKVNRGTDNYVAYLLSGIFVFFYTRSVMVGSIASIISNVRLVANLRFPRLVLPISALVESAIGFLASLAVLIVMIGPLSSVWPTASIVWLLPAFAIQTTFSLGLAALVARIAVPFRDVNNLVPYFVRLWLYVSPIIYPVEYLLDTSPALRRVLEFNPMFPILSVYRHALMGRPLDMGLVVQGALWAVAFLLFGVYLFVRNEPKMARYL